MAGWTRTALVAVFLGAGVATGLGLGRAFDPGARASAQAATERPAAPAALLALQDSFARVAEFSGPSVVHITSQVGAADDPWQTQGVGSGVVVSHDGHIITNHHVVDAGGARHSLRVRFGDGNEVEARVVGADSETDLALVKVNPKDVKLVPITFADSEKVRVGDWCLAIGSPFGYNNSVTVGIVSAKHRRAQLAQPYQDFIQTDAAINPGNSGGALVNIHGELLGINTAIVSGTRGSDGVGFAIASNLVKWVKDQLVAHGRVRRGYLGIVPLDIDPQLVDAFRERYGIGSLRELLDELGLKTPRGVLVYRVERNTPAEKGGLKERDVILEFNGRAVVSQSDMLFKVAEAAPKSTVALKILREKEELELKLELGDRPPEDLRRSRRR